MSLSTNILYIMSGLPGTGKTTLSELLSQHLQAFHLRIDTIEQALRDLCSYNVEGEGYRLAYRIAADNLKLGHSVIADSVNPWPLTREEWHGVAISNGCDFIDIEVSCSNKQEHRQRVENRAIDIPGLNLPSWKDVCNRDYHDWRSNVLKVDTFDQSPSQSLQTLSTLIRKHSSSESMH